jgi:hypothetical protein
MAYTGAAIDGAAVSYRVVRQVHYPDWWYWLCWWYPRGSDGSQEITHGTAETETDGSFAITFTATPDRSVEKSAEPIFTYIVYADVTDTAGETRLAQLSVNVGYTALKASMSTGDWQEKGKPVEITVSTRTLDGEGQASDVQVRIHKLKAPKSVQRAALPEYRPYWRQHGLTGAASPAPDLSNPNSWDLGKMVMEKGLTTSDAGTFVLTAKLNPGLYRAVLVTEDRFENEVTALLPIRVVDTRAKHCALKIPSMVVAPKWSLEPGESFTALWGTGYESGRAFIEIEHRGKMLRSFWSDPERTQEVIEQVVTEDMRGGFTLHVTQVRENRAYLVSRRINVPWSNKRLQVRWKHFVSKLEPGQKESWTSIVSGPDANKAVAEMVATLYDESLDAFRPHTWMQSFNVFRQDRSCLQSHFQNSLQRLSSIHGRWSLGHRNASLIYRSFPVDLMARHVLWDRRGRRGHAKMMQVGCCLSPVRQELATLEESKSVAVNTYGGGAPAGNESASAAGSDLMQVSARKNLHETAFFFPQLVSGEDGTIRMQFTMPEGLTQWKFMGFAHDRELRSGFLQDSVITAKDLMVQPNPPRFLREGDELEWEHYAFVRKNRFAWS